MMHVPAEGSDAVGTFLAGWYGPPTSVQAVVARSEPPALRRWRQSVSRWQRRIVVQNRLVDGDRAEVEDGLAVFYVENQGVWLWAYGEGADPPVYDRENEDGRAWQPSGVSLSDFLFQMTVVETVLGSERGAGASDLSHPDFDRIVGPLTAVDMTPWRWPGPEHRLWLGEGIAAFGGVNDTPGAQEAPGSRWEVWLAAVEDSRLDYLSELDVDWDWNSRIPPG
jgi:hypothetical protein